MFFSRLPKLALILALLTSVSCEQASTTTNNTANNTTNTTQPSTTATTQPTTQSTTQTTTAQGPEINPSQTPSTVQTPTPNPSAQAPKAGMLQNNVPMTREEVLKLKKAEALKVAEKKAATAGPPSTVQPNQARPYVPAVAPEALPKEQRDNPTIDTKNLSRSVVRYYNFLTEIRGLNLNLPKEMIGGASAFKAVDTLQFTFKNQPVDKPIVILVAEFNNPEEQAKGTNFMRKLGADGRKSFQVKNYSILIKGGDEKLHKILTDSLEQFR